LSHPKIESVLPDEEPMRHAGWLALLVAVLGMTGCVTARATMLTPDRPPPVPENEVTIYLTADEVPPECVRIALIHASGDVDMTNEQQMFTAARRRAGKVGANAIVLGSMRDPRMDTRVAAELLGISAERKGEMIGYRCPSSAA